jgi:hypothetical protein
MCGCTTTKQEVAEAGEVETESGGFHVFELHIPTVGAGIVILLIVVAAAYFLLHCYSRFKKRGAAQRGARGSPGGSLIAPGGEPALQDVGRQMQLLQLQHLQMLPQRMMDPWNAGPPRAVRWSPQPDSRFEEMPPQSGNRRGPGRVATADRTQQRDSETERYQDI